MKGSVNWEQLHAKVVEVEVFWLNMSLPRVLNKHHEVSNRKGEVLYKIAIKIMNFEGKKDKARYDGPWIKQLLLSCIRVVDDYSNQSGTDG